MGRGTPAIPTYRSPYYLNARNYSRIMKKLLLSLCLLIPCLAGAQGASCDRYVDNQMLDDGTQLRVDPKANAELAPCFATGASIDVWGDGLKRKGVTVVDVHEIAFASDL